MMNKCGLYIHIPFCNHLCSYCDFTKRVSNDFVKAKYIDALIHELKIYQSQGFDFKNISSIYIGGGTPSSLNVDLLKQLFNYLESIIDLKNLNEFTFEVNPEDLNDELSDSLFSASVTRVSIGIQTLNPVLQKQIGRTFDFDKFKNDYNYLKTKIPNINFDLMYALPNQTVLDCVSTLEQLMALEPKHFSIYSLILEKHTKLYHDYLKGDIKLIDEDLELEMLDAITKSLNGKYFKYEVSNYAMDGYESYSNIISPHSASFSQKRDRGATTGGGRGAERRRTTRATSTYTTSRDTIRRSFSSLGEGQSRERTGDNA